MKGKTSNLHVGKSEKIRLLEKVGYASGDFASCLYYGIFMNFLMYFYTDVFGIAATTVATMIFFTRTWDWINDPIMGMISDRTRSKYGQFRPWLLWMCGPFAVAGIAAFITFDLSPTAKVVYAYVTYTTLTMIYTAINVPYSSLMGVMTSRSADRTDLASYRFIGAFSATLVVNGSMLYLVKFLGQGNDQIGFPLTVALYGFMAAGLFLFTFFTCKERIAPPVSQNLSIKRNFSSLVKNGPWIAIVAISAITITWIGLRTGATIYYFKYVCGNELWAGTFLMVGSAVQIIGVMASKHVVAFLGSKRRAFAVINYITAFLMISFYFIDPQNFTFIIIHQVLVSLVLAPLMPIYWSMIADTADYGAMKLGQRSTGLLFSAGTFASKIGWSIGPALALLLMDSYGFQPNEVQSSTSIHGIQLIMSLFPGLIALLTGFSLLLYKIDQKTEIDLQRFLSSNASNQQGTGNKP